jgi:hypothetical protein
MNLDARHLAWLIQIATLGIVILMGLWLSPAVAATLSPGYPVDAILLAMRAMLTRTRRALGRLPQRFTLDNTSVLAPTLKLWRSCHG